MPILMCPDNSERIPDNLERPQVAGERTVEGARPRRETTVLVGPGETAQFHASSEVRMLDFRLPNLAGIEATARPAQFEAAE